MRSRRCARGPDCRSLGITSACAEQTTDISCYITLGGDHLRVCGADEGCGESSSLLLGSPPRVRSRRCLPRPLCRRDGITSACAEQTWSASTGSTAGRDHLRVCGADFSSSTVLPFGMGSPPRVRSRPDSDGMRATPGGITSACAEQTPDEIPRAGAGGDHLRVCGADYGDRLQDFQAVGSPPRVRSRPPMLTH